LYNTTSTTAFSTLSLHDALPIYFVSRGDRERHDFSRPVQCPKGSQKGVQISIHAAEVNYAFVHDRRGHDCADSDELVEVNVHVRSEEHTSELQSPCNLVCRLLLE